MIARRYSHSFSRPTGRGLFTARSASIADSVAREETRKQLNAAETIPSGRYEARVGDKGWVVWDSKTNEPVVAFLGQFDRAWAEKEAQSLNRQYAEAVRA